jgi:hypothetical protein
VSTRRMTSAGMAGLLGLILVGSPSARAAGPMLLPHHAVYKLTLASSSGNKAPADATGMISYDFSGSDCDGYKTVFRQVTALQPPEGDTRVSETKTTTLEGSNSATFAFDSRTTVNEGDPQNVKGEARREGDGTVDVSLQQPDAASLDVKAPVFFPTEHLAHIIAAAQSGTKILSASVFDGSDTGKKVYNTLSVIGAPIATPAADKAAQDDTLKNARRWPVTISYFEQDQGDSQPAYVLSFELYENGVSRALKVDYGNFALRGELVEFKPGEASACGK